MVYNAENWKMIGGLSVGHCDSKRAIFTIIILMRTSVIYLTTEGFDTTVS